MWVSEFPFQPVILPLNQKLMKRIALLILLLMPGIILIAQKKTVVAKKVPPKPVSILKTLNDSASYAIGISVANVYKKQGITRLNTTIISKAINDLLNGNKTLFGQETANQVINRYMVKLQSEKPTAKPVPVKPLPANTTSLLKTLDDSASYAVGINVADFYKQFGITKLNTTCVSKSINEILGGKKVLFDEPAVNTVMNVYITDVQMEKSKPAILAGEKFLAQNKLRPEVKTTASGLQYEVVTEGTGQSPLATDSVTCNYKGTLIDGTEFDNSYKRGSPITFALKKVIAGWTEGLQLMKPGAKYKFYVPYQLGYGVFDHGASIPGGSALLFEVDLLDVRKIAQ
jgi:FKBP-type peptidyl-prolyl cis-trans isomerase